MSQEWIYTFVYLAWLVGASCFVLGLHRMNSPATGRTATAQRRRHGHRRQRDAGLAAHP